MGEKARKWAFSTDFLRKAEHASKIVTISIGEMFGNFIWFKGDREMPLNSGDWSFFGKSGSASQIRETHHLWPWESWQVCYIPLSRRFELQWRHQINLTVCMGGGMYSAGFWWFHRVFFSYMAKSRLDSPPPHNSPWGYDQWMAVSEK